MSTRWQDAPPSGVRSTAMLWSYLGMIVMALVGASGCGPSLRGTADADAVRAVIERDMLLLEQEAPAPAFLERLAEHTVVVVGEYHGISHHDALVGEFMVGLHDHGFRTLLLEYPQAHGWLLDGYARGLLSTPGEAAMRTYGPMLDRVRELNAGLAPDEQVSVRAIDVNLREDDFLPAFRGLMHQFGQPRVLRETVAEIEAGGSRGDLLSRLERHLAEHEEALRDDWGEAAFNAVQDIVGAELLSLEVRAARAGRQRDEARERVMEALVDQELARAPGGTLVNVGYYHAQKTSRDGTVKTWLAEHLVTASPHAEGSVFVLVVVPASGEKTFGDQVRSFDVATDSPDNELFRLMSERSGQAPAFLALDDELFSTERVVINYLPRLDTEPPAEVFDGFVLLPEVQPAER